MTALASAGLVAEQRTVLRVHTRDLLASESRARRNAAFAGDAFVAELGSAGLGSPRYVVGPLADGRTPDRITLDYDVDGVAHTRTWRLAPAPVGSTDAATTASRATPRRAAT